MAQITYDDKDSALPSSNPRKLWRDDDANEVKTVVNDNDVTMSKIIRSATASGTNTYSATVTPAVASYVHGDKFMIKFSNAPTGASTLNLGPSAKPLHKGPTTQVGNGDFPANSTFLVTYDSDLDVLLMLGAPANTDVDITSKADAKATTASNPGSYTLDAGDLSAVNNGQTLIIQGDDSGDLTVPLNATIAFGIGTMIGLRGYDNVVATGGVTITGTRGDLTLPSGQTSVLEKTGTNSWILNNGSAAGGGATYYGQTTGVNTYVVALTPTLTALAAGVSIKVKFKDASTGASTVNADTLGSKKLYKNPTTQVGTGDITDEQIYDMTYDATLDSAAGGWLIDGLAGGGSVAFATASEINTGTEAAKATAPDQLAASKYIMRRGSKLYAASTTAANTYTGAFTPAIAAADLGAGTEIRVLFTNHNTGAATFNADSTGALAIVNADGSALRAYQITDSHLAVLVHNGTSWVLMNPASRRSVLGNNVSLNNSAGTWYLVIGGSGSTLDAKNLEEIKYDGPVVGSSLANNFTVNPTNDSLLQYGSFVAAINSAIVITFPSSFVMATGEWRWINGSKTFTTEAAGYYEFVWTRTIDGKFMLKVTDKFPTS